MEKSRPTLSVTEETSGYRVSLPLGPHCEVAAFIFQSRLPQRRFSPCFYELNSTGANLESSRLEVLHNLQDFEIRIPFQRLNGASCIPSEVFKARLSIFHGSGKGGVGPVRWSENDPLDQHFVPRSVNSARSQRWRRLHGKKAGRPPTSKDKTPAVKSRKWCIPLSALTYSQGSLTDCVTETQKSAHAFKSFRIGTLQDLAVVDEDPVPQSWGQNFVF